MPWLLKAQPYDPGTSGLVTLYASDIGFSTTPSESPANTYWKRRIDAPLRQTQSLWSGGDIGGYSEADFGRATLANDDGQLDGWADYDWGGRLIQIWRTDVAKPVLSDFAMTFNGVAEEFVSGDIAAIELRDMRVLLDVPFGRGQFSGAGGVNGTSQLTGRGRPFSGGECYQFEPVLIDGTNWVYMVDPEGFDSILNAYDSADEHTTAGSDYADYAALIAADLSSVDYATCKAEGLYRNSGEPAGRITLNVRGVAPSSTWIYTYADLVEHVVTTMTTLTSGDLDSAAFSAFNSAQPAKLQYWWDGAGSKTVLEFLSEVSDTTGAYFGFNDERKFTIGRYEGPAVSADHFFSARQIYDLRPRQVDRRLKSLNLGYRRYWSPLGDNDFAASVPAAVREGFKAPYRWTGAATDTDAETESLLAREEEDETLFVDASDAEDERDRRLDLYGPMQKGFDVEVPLTAGLVVGQTVELTFPRHGLSSGENFVVLEADADADKEVHRLAGIGS